MHLRVIFSIKFRIILSEKLMELGNIVAGVMIFGPLISKSDFSLVMLFVGTMIGLICYIMSYIILN